MTEQLLGRTDHFSIWYEDAVLDQPRARTVLETCERDFEELRRWFGIHSRFGGHLIDVVVGRISNPLGAADNGGYVPGGGTTIEIRHIPPSDGSPAELDDKARALFVAEAAEVLMSYQNQTHGHTVWDPGASNGEGLSQIAAELLYPRAYTGISSGGPAMWLNSQREDWVARNESTDTNSTSFGCAQLFIHYLRTQCGYPIDQIVQHGRPTLEGTFTALTGTSGGDAGFMALLQHFFPIVPGTISLTTQFPNVPDNPFPLLGPDRRRLDFGLAIQTVQESDTFHPETVTGKATVRAGLLCPEKAYTYTIFNAVQRATCTVHDHFGFGAPVYSWRLNGIALPESTTTDDTPLTITATVQVGADSGGISGERQIDVTYNAGSLTLTIFNADHPGRVHLDIELEARERYIPADATTTTVKNGVLETLHTVYEDQFYADEHNCENRLQDILKGLSQHPNPAWRTLGDPSPELVDHTSTLSALVHDVTLLEKTDPEQARVLRNALGAKLGIAPQALIAKNFPGRRAPAVGTHRPRSHNT